MLNKNDDRPFKLHKLDVDTNDVYYYVPYKHKWNLYSYNKNKNKTNLNWIANSCYEISEEDVFFEFL